MGKMWEKALALLPELADDLFGPWLKWIVIISQFLVELCTDSELLAMAGPLLRSLLFLFLLFFAIGWIEDSKDKGMAPKLFLWAASVACMVAPFWLGLCGSLLLASCGLCEGKEFKDPAVKWWIVFATHRTGLGSAVMPAAVSHIGELLYASMASLACMFGVHWGAIIYCIALLFPYLKACLAYVVGNFMTIALSLIALFAVLCLIGIIIESKESKEKTVFCQWMASAIICICAPFWLSCCASMLIGFTFSSELKDLAVQWFIVFIAQQVTLYLITPPGLWSVCIYVVASFLMFANWFANW